MDYYPHLVDGKHFLLMRAVTDEHVLCKQMVRSGGKNVEPLLEITLSLCDCLFHFLIHFHLGIHFSPKFSS